MMMTRCAATGLGALLVWGCTANEPQSVAESQLAAGSCRELVIPWGSGADQVGLAEPGAEHLGRGPQAIAVTPTGTVLVLDAINGRVVSVTDAGAVRIVAGGIPRDAEDLAVGAEGAFAVYSPLQATAWLFDADGAPAGSVAIDRAIRHVTGIALGASRQVRVRTAYQETFTAGSPAAPTALATELAGKREGAFVLPDGRGVATRKTATGAVLAVVTNPAGRRSTATAVHAIPGDADAAQLVAASGTVACARTELVTQNGEQISVARRAVCIDATTGHVAADVALAAPGLYLPPHELALGGSRLALLEPRPEHLSIRTCEVSR